MGPCGLLLGRQKKKAVDYDTAPLISMLGRGGAFLSLTSSPTPAAEFKVLAPDPSAASWTLQLLNSFLVFPHHGAQRVCPQPSASVSGSWG